MTPTARQFFIALLMRDPVLQRAGFTHADALKWADLYHPDE